VVIAYLEKAYYGVEKYLRQQCYGQANSTITMVKKRVRDPEVLAEAPPAAGADDDSGSDDVGERAPICA
jgi:hypothetical protein